MTEQERFEFAVKIVLKHEGGLSNNPSDPGGITNFGVSFRFLKESGIDIDDDGDIDADDVKKLSQQKAKDIYRKYWWDKYRYNKIENLDIATKVFDLSVNMGSKQSHKILQRAINRSQLKPLEVDGILGPNTLRAANYLSSKLLLSQIRECAAEYYSNLAKQNPTLKVFLKGWMNRAYA